MNTHEINKMLYAAKKELDGKNTIALIGERNCGKTVTVTLLYNTLSNDFLDKHDDKYYVNISEGYNKLVRTHGKIFVKGLFPPPNLPNSGSKIRLEIATIDRAGKDMELLVHDIAGEDIQELLYKEYKNDDELIENIITTHKEQNELYGPLSYLIFAKTYIILIDCNNFDKWGTEQIRLAQIITSIYEMQKKIENVRENKMINPIAIVFTKSDKLKEISNNSQDNEQLFPKKLFEKYFKLVASNLKRYHSGNLEFFQFDIKGVQKVSLEESKKIKNEEKNELVEIEQERINKKNIESKKEKDKIIEDRVENASKQEYEKAKGENQPEEEIVRRVKLAEELERKTAEKEYHTKQESENIIKRSEDVIKEPGFEGDRYKIQLPIEYSHDEYSKFILWLISNNT